MKKDEALVAKALVRLWHTEQGADALTVRDLLARIRLTGGTSR